MVISFGDSKTRLSANDARGKRVIVKIERQVGDAENGGWRWEEMIVWDEALRHCRAQFACVHVEIIWDLLVD